MCRYSVMCRCWIDALLLSRPMDAPRMRVWPFRSRNIDVTWASPSVLYTLLVAQREKSDEDEQTFKPTLET